MPNKTPTDFFPEEIQECKDKFDSKAEQYGDSWKTMPIAQLWDRLDGEWAELQSRQSQDGKRKELLDIVNISLILMNRLNGGAQDNNTVRFKTDDRFFHKELNGQKPNTVRKADWDDSRFWRLKEWQRTRQYGTIEILHADGELSFQRMVTDVTFWEDFVIISWEHPNERIGE